MAQFVSLTGASGRPYQYQVCDVNVLWRSVPGNYAFLSGDHLPQYIGETGNFATRRPGPSHEKWAEAQRYGAVMVVAHETSGGEAARKIEEADLIRAYNPPANVQHKPTNALAEGLFGLGSGVGRKTLLGG